MSKARAKLIEDAKAAGYTIEERGTILRITRPFGPHKKQKGILLYDSGTAIDITMRLDAAKGMRSYKDMRKVLGI